jgi:hypothetical protein
MNEGTRLGKSIIRLLGISAEGPTNGIYLYLYFHERITFCIAEADKSWFKNFILALITADLNYGN